MKIFLVVMAVWDMAYRGVNVTPALVQEMPSIEACEAVAKAILELSHRQQPQRAVCIQVPSR